MLVAEKVVDFQYVYKTQKRINIGIIGNTPL